MNEHDAMRELLPLAVAGALDAAQQQQLERHLAACSACAAELDAWRDLAGALRRLPTPRAPAELVESARSQIEKELAADAERRWERQVMVFLVLFAWTVTLASWPIVRLFSGGVATWLDLRANQVWYALAAYTALAWLAAGVAAAMLALQHRAVRRTT